MQAYPHQPTSPQRTTSNEFQHFRTCFPAHKQTRTCLLIVLTQHVQHSICSPGLPGLGRSLSNPLLNQAIGDCLGKSGAEKLAPNHQAQSGASAFKKPVPDFPVILRLSLFFNFTKPVPATKEKEGQHQAQFSAALKVLERV